MVPAGIVLPIVALVGIFAVLITAAANRRSRDRAAGQAMDIDALRRALAQPRPISDEERIQWNATVARLERLEHAIDIVAIEVERLGEGQRFVSKMLSESSGPGTAERNAPGSSRREQG